MDCTNEFVQQHINMYGQQVEQWKVDHQEAMACRNLEDAIRFGQMILTSLQKRNEQNKKILVQDVAKICRMYVEWFNQSIPVIAAIDEMERRNYLVDGAADFRSLYQSVGLTIAQIERLGRNATSVVAGEGVTLLEAIRGLKGDSGSSCG